MGCAADLITTTVITIITIIIIIIILILIHRHFVIPFLLSLTCLPAAAKFSAELKQCKFDDSSLFMFGIGLDLKIGSLREDYLRLDVGRLCESFAGAKRRLVIINPDSLFSHASATAAGARLLVMMICQFGLRMACIGISLCCYKISVAVSVFFSRSLSLLSVPFSVSLTPHVSVALP